MLYLVHTRAKDPAPYSQQYRIFKNPEDAIACAKENGYEDVFGMGFNWKLGWANTCSYGDVHVLVMAIEEE